MSLDDVIEDWGEFSPIAHWKKPTNQTKQKNNNNKFLNIKMFPQSKVNNWGKLANIILAIILWLETELISNLQ